MQEEIRAITGQNWRLEDAGSPPCLSAPIGLGCAPPDGKAVHAHSDGTWWFWDEIWDDEYGPYSSREQAENACINYAAHI